MGVQAARARVHTARRRQRVVLHRGLVVVVVGEYNRLEERGLHRHLVDAVARLEVLGEFQQAESLIRAFRGGFRGAQRWCRRARGGTRGGVDIRGCGRRIGVLAALLEVPWCGNVRRVLQQVGDGNFEGVEASVTHGDDAICSKAE